MVESYDRFFDCFSLRSADEYSGSIQYPGHKGTSGIWTASAFVQFTALLVCLGAWLCTERTSFLKIAQVEPKYMLLGGAIGAFITYTVIRSMDALGPAKAVMLIVIAQLAVAYIIELFGWFGVEKQPWEWRKAVGMAVAIVGIIIFKWK